MTSARLAVVCAVVVWSAVPASAEPWYRGPRGKARVVHLSIATAGGAAFVVSEAVFKSSLVADDCRWCGPPGIDASVRNSLVWDDTGRAGWWSNATGYVSAPALSLGTVAVLGLVEDGTWGRLLDDTVPILETVAVSQVVTQLLKFAVARQRPFVHYAGAAHSAETDDNMSFYSGHAALAFGVVTSAGMVLHWRGSRLEWLMWGAGMALSATTGYLRIAADKHYFTDVLTGSVIGVAAGLTIPRWMRDRPDLAIMPTGNGVAVVGAL
ncbi:MAG: phosphatase PAP2 family protein [Kofleriaceae bacterium]